MFIEFNTKKGIENTEMALDIYVDKLMPYQMIFCVIFTSYSRRNCGSFKIVANEKCKLIRFSTSALRYNYYL